MKQEKPYQEEAIDDLLYQARGCLDRDRQNTIVFQSPTGSGKTYMMTRFIGALARETEKPVCFLWVSIGAGNLYEHSFRSVKRRSTRQSSAVFWKTSFSAPGTRSGKRSWSFSTGRRSATSGMENSPMC